MLHRQVQQTVSRRRLEQVASDENNKSKEAQQTLTTKTRSQNDKSQTLNKTLTTKTRSQNNKSQTLNKELSQLQATTWQRFQ